METAIMTVLFVGFLVGVFYATRRKTGRRYQKQAPERADADKDAWGWPG